MSTLAVCPYTRLLRQPLQTAHGLWRQRRGLIIRFSGATGAVGFGEIAPIPWFGTETWEQAWAFCDRLVHRAPLTEWPAIPATLPASQFGLVTARLAAQTGPLTPAAADLPPDQLSALLPAGAAALEAWQPLWQRGHRTFKWKVGVAAVTSEHALLQALVQALPTTARLRLDANGGLSPAEAISWLALCDRLGERVEYLEQPLSPSTILDWIVSLGDRFGTAIALDESVATFQQLRHSYRQVGERVIYCLKPAIAGDPQQLSQFCIHHRLQVVISSALETPVGRKAILTLAQQWWAAGLPRRPVGLGVDHWFADDWQQLTEEALWMRLNPPSSRCKSAGELTG